ncbi:hypothetical protein HDV01_002703 [Terramyces sp. JEL0728]|nr:hypothetical protein HDV01_002703 [Terramyces sp. JEL0728]
MSRKRSKSENLASDEYTLYRALCPKKGSVLVPFHSIHELLYQQAKERFPERFNFNFIDNLFETWKNSGNLTPETVKTYFDFNSIQRDTNIHQQQSYQFTYDKLIWQANIIVKSNIFNGNWRLETHLKFPNNGFLYSDINELNKIQENITRHKYETWCMIDATEYKSKLPYIFSWAQEFFGCTSQVQFFYCFEGERVDIKFRKSGDDDGLIVTFEPGYPEEFVDLWQ